MSSNYFYQFIGENKTKDNDWAHKEALIQRMDRICDAEKARADANLERLGCKPKTASPLQPSARDQSAASFGEWKIRPFSVDSLAGTDLLKEKIPRSPETLFAVLEDPLHHEMERANSSFSSVDKAPEEMREIPLIHTPEVFLPQTSIIPTPPPQPTAPKPRMRKSLIPVMFRRIPKRPGCNTTLDISDGLATYSHEASCTGVIAPAGREGLPAEKEAVSLPRAEPLGEPLKKGPKLFKRNSIAPQHQPAAAPKTTNLPSLKADPPKIKRFGPRTAVGFEKTTKLQKPAHWTLNPLPKEELKPLRDPVQCLSEVFRYLSSDEWEKKVFGLKLIRALAQHHPDTLLSKLHDVCVAVTDEIKNLRSSVACTAINTLGSLYTHLQKKMDVALERSGRALLLRVAQASANMFVQQQVNLALEAMVRNCSPARVLRTLIHDGLSHLSMAVKARTAQQLHLLADEMGVNAVLTAGPSFTPYFLRALSKMCLDPAAEVRHHGHDVLEELCLHKDFTKLWQISVGERERQSLKEVLQKARRMKTSRDM